MYNVIATGSTGNAVIYFDRILVDCGVSFAKIEKYAKSIDIVLLTHEHKDHINISTLKRLQSSKPSLRIGCCEWMLQLLGGLKNVDTYQIGVLYDYKIFQVCPIKLFHDVPNCGYRIFIGNKKIIHATDTAHLNGISAKGYDLFAIEHNYNDETVYQHIAEKEARGEFCHQKGSINTHLSDQQARDFIFNNRKESSQVLRLHQSKSF